MIKTTSFGLRGGALTGRSIFAIFMAAAFIVSGFFVFDANAITNVEIITAPSGTEIHNSNSDLTVVPPSPFLPVLGSSVTRNTDIYYGIKAISTIDSPNVYWRVTVSHSSADLNPGMVNITEKGWFDAFGHEVIDSTYLAADSGNNLVFTGNSGWSVANGDDFTNVDLIRFNSNAPFGTYIITRELIDFATSSVLSNSYTQTVNLVSSVTITPATGGQNISVDTAPSGTTTPVGEIVISEGVVGDISLGDVTFIVPAGFEFKTTGTPPTSAKSPNNSSFAFFTPVGVTANAITFTVAIQSNIPTAIRIVGVEVKPIQTDLPSGTLTVTGTAGVTGTAASLSTVAGAVTKLAFTAQPGSTEYGSDLSPQPVVETQDQFGNHSTNELAASKNVILTLTNGTGLLQGNATLDIGTGAGNGTATFSGLKVNSVGLGKELTATTTGLTSAVSSFFEITAKPVTAMITVSSKIYDGTTTATILTRDLSGVVEGDDVSATGGIATFVDPNVGVGKSVSAAGLSLIGTSAANYIFDGNATGTGDITAKELTVSGLSAVSKIYDSNTFASVSEIPIPVGIVDADEVSIFGSAVGTFENANVGTSKSVTISGLSLVGTAARNYFLTQPTLSADITAKSITVTPTLSQSKVFGTADPTFTYTNTPLVGGDVFTGVLSRVDGENVGTYTYTLGTLSAGSNYTLNLAAGTFEITAKPITVTPTAGQSKVFGTTNPVFAYTATPLVGSDTFTGTLSRAPGSNIGIYAYTLGTLTAGSNYILTLALDTFEIVPKPITITPDSGQSKVFGTADPTFTYTNTALMDGDTLIGELGRVVGEDIGMYAFTLGTLDAGTNYTLTLTPDTFEIIKATPTIIWSNPADIVADTPLSGSELNATASVPGSFVYTPPAGTVFTVAGGQTLTVDFFPTDNLNYNSADASIVLKIVPAALSKLIVSANPLSLQVGNSSTVSIIGQDQFGNIASNSSPTVVVINADNGGRLVSTLVTLNNGLASTSLTTTSVGDVHVNASSGILTPGQVTVIFTVAPVVDTTPPVISDIHTGTINQTSTTVNWDTNELSDSQVEYGLTSSYGSTTSLTSMLVLGHTKTLSSLTPGTLYHYRVKSRDAAGNLAISGDNVFTTAASTADVTAPVITNIQVANISSVSATVTWTTNEGSSSQVEYGPTSGYGFSTVLDSTSATVHSVNLSGLIPDITYHFRVKSADAVPNFATSDDQTFDTNPANNPPVVPGVTNITAVKTFAIADDTYANGWEWVFDVTLSVSESSVLMKFADWISGSNNIAVANNIRFFSAQASDANSEGTAVTIGEANVYSGSMNLNTDFDLSRVGRQVQIHVQAKVPGGSAAGSYSTSYGIKSANP